MDEWKDIIVTDTLGIIKTNIEKEYLAHMLCLGGTCRYRFNEREFELHAGDLSIIRKRKMIDKVQPSEDFRCKIIYATPEFIELSTPQSNYGMKGSFGLVPQSCHAPHAGTANRLPSGFRAAGTAHPEFRTPLLSGNTNQCNAGCHSRFFRLPRQSVRRK